MTEHTVFPMSFSATFGDGKAVSSSPDPVQATVDVLQDASQFGAWTLTEPIVEKQHQTTQKTKQNRTETAIYVWSPVDSDLQQFDGEHSAIDSNETVEVAVWHLAQADGSGHTDCKVYQEDLINYLQGYANDNETNTEFHQVRPTGSNDSRHERVARRTDHYIMGVQCTVHNHRG